MKPRVGMVFLGYGSGNFGRDGCYGARIEAFGEDWVVLRTPAGKPQFAQFDSYEHLLNSVESAYTEAAPNDED